MAYTAPASPPPELDLCPTTSYLTSPPTPPREPEPSSICPTASILPTALFVLSTEARALIALEEFYATSTSAQIAFTQTVQMLAATIQCGGKLVICGIGKSGKIGQKMVATMNSLGLVSVFLHPSEAMHGDLGVVCDVSLFLFFPSAQSSAWHGQLSPYKRRNR